MPYWDALFPRKLRIQSHMQAAGAEAKDQKNSSNQTKAQCRGTGAERKKAGNMHEEPLSEEREKREKKRQMQTKLDDSVMLHLILC